MTYFSLQPFFFSTDRALDPLIYFFWWCGRNYRLGPTSALLGPRHITWMFFLTSCDAKIAAHFRPVFTCVQQTKATDIAVRCQQPQIIITPSSIFFTGSCLFSILINSFPLNCWFCLSSVMQYSFSQWFFFACLLSVDWSILFLKYFRSQFFSLHLCSHCYIQ